jgi:hypothetical protein
MESGTNGFATAGGGTDFGTSEVGDVAVGVGSAGKAVDGVDPMQAAKDTRITKVNK